MIANPKLLGIKKIGHDLDKAQYQGMKDIFASASSMWCTQHVKQRDAMQLENICSAGDKRRILADIYMDLRMIFCCKVVWLTQMMRAILTLN